jgi:hypothetical protein
MFTRMELPIFESIVGFYTLKGIEFKHAKVDRFFFIVKITINWILILKYSKYFKI